MGHAWVEVYIDGLGWIAVEVTGSSANDEPLPEPPAPTPTPPAKETITVKPVYLWKEFDGTPLTHNGQIVSDSVLEILLMQGYTYEVVINGSQTNVGSSSSTVVSFVLFDPNGQDVTDQYDIKLERGVLKVTKTVIKIYLYEKSFEYNASKVSYAPDEYVLLSIPSGLTLSITDIRVALTNAGVIRADDINEDIAKWISFAVYRNGSTVDLSEQFDLVIVDYETGGDYNVLSITQRKLQLTTGSATKYLGKDPLTNHTFYISKGYLAEGHTVKILFTGEQAVRGSSKNYVDAESFTVFDENGNDVTENYTIQKGYDDFGIPIWDVVLGVLTVI